MPHLQGFVEERLVDNRPFDKLRHVWIEIPSNREDGINNDGKVDRAEWAKGGVAAFVP